MLIVLFRSSICCSDSFHHRPLLVLIPSSNKMDDDRDRYWRSSHILLLPGLRHPANDGRKSCLLPQSGGIHLRFAQHLPGRREPLSLHPPHLYRGQKLTFIPVFARLDLFSPSESTVAPCLMHEHIFSVFNVI